MTALFRDNSDVAFADVNLQEESIRGPPHNPGQGGWPTIRYFNKETGYEGAGYKQKTSKSVCDELGPSEKYMQQFVEEAGKAERCNIGTLKGCSGKEVKFLEKWGPKSPSEQATELARLQGMNTGYMRQELKDWHGARVQLLQKHVDAAGNDKEL